MAKYKTEKRKANVGERILITNAEASRGRYGKGSVGTARKYSYNETGIYVNEWDGIVWNEEYEVIIGAKPSKSERISLLESQVAELTAKVDALEKPKETTVHNVTINVPTDVNVNTYTARLKERLAELTTPKPTPNEQRKAVIERAKAFVTEVSEKAKGDDTNDIGNAIYRDRTTVPEFHVNEKKRTVAVLLKGAHTPYLMGKAIAKCAPDDVFNADIGKAIALGRALGLDVSEFENAVKPTKVIPGMKVDLDNAGLAEVNEYLRNNGIIVSDTEARY